MTLEQKIAYCAGIIDGEGCITIMKRKPRPGQFTKGSKTQDYKVGYHLRISATMRNNYPLLLLQEVFGGSVNLQKTGMPSGLNYKMWVWQCFSDEAVNTLSKIAYILQAKRDQAILGLNFARLKKKYGGMSDTEIQEEQDFRKAFYLKMKELKVSYHTV